MDPTLTIAVVFAASLAILLGHAARVGWLAYRTRRQGRGPTRGESDEHATDGSQPANLGHATHGEIKPTGLAPGGVVGEGSPTTATRGIAETKPSRPIKSR